MKLTSDQSRMVQELEYQYPHASVINERVSVPAVPEPVDGVLFSLGLPAVTDSAMLSGAEYAVVTGDGRVVPVTVSDDGTVDVKIESFLDEDTPVQDK